MEIEGRIIVVTPERSGVSPRTGNTWKVQSFVIETHEQYPRRCCFDVFGADRLAQMNIKEGEELRVSFDIDAHEHNGRWYNNIRAWRVDRVDSAAAQSQQQGAPAPGADPFMPVGSASVLSSDSTDDLPF